MMTKTFFLIVYIFATANGPVGGPALSITPVASRAACEELAKDVTDMLKQRGVAAPYVIRARCSEVPAHG